MNETGQLIVFGKEAYKTISNTVKNFLICSEMSDKCVDMCDLFFIEDRAHLGEDKCAVR